MTLAEVTGRHKTAKVPPHNLEAERSLIGAMLIVTETIVEARAVVSPGDFYGRPHGALCAAIYALHDQGEAVDVVGVVELLRRQGEYEEHWAAEMTAMIIEAAPHAARRHVAIVAECAQQRRYIALADELRARAYDREDPSKLADWLDQARPASAVGRAPSWAPVDLGPVLAGEQAAEPPAFLHRSDGTAMIYRGKVHAFNAESEAGKTWASLALCKERLGAGETVAFLDFEDEAAGLVERLQDLGVEPGAVLERFVYLRPDDPFNAAARAGIEALMVERKPSVVVVDGVTECMVANGWSLLDNDDIARFYAAIPRPLARTGAAVVLLDHVPKDKDAHGRHAIGGQHKLAGIDGAAYKFDVVRPFGRGLTGTSRITVTKDRPGHVRAVAAGGKSMGEMRMIPGEGNAVRIAFDAGKGEEPFRPTHLMEHLSRALEDSDEPLSLNGVLNITTGHRETRIMALNLLVDEHYVERRQKGQAHLHRSVQPYRAPVEEDF